MMRPAAFALAALAVLVTAEPIPQLGSATVTLATDGVTVPVVVPFPTFVPPGLIPVASSILLKERDATTTSDPLDFIGSATVTLVTDGVTVPVVIPFPTFVPPEVIPLASSILLKERDATTTSDPLDFIGSATVTLVTDGVTVPVVVPFPTFVPPGVIPIASSILLKEKRAVQTPEA